MESCLDICPAEVPALAKIPGFMIPIEKVHEVMVFVPTPENPALLRAAAVLFELKRYA